MMGDFPMPSSTPTSQAIRRLQRDYQKLIEDPIPLIHAMPADWNILEWHYVIEGSPGTDYEGGFYYGKLVFQPDFPWNPPSICMITPNGRFHCNMRLCLSISDYHPESWNPGWNVSSILVGLHSFMNEDSIATGVKNLSASQRRHLASVSMEFNMKIPQFASMFSHLAGYSGASSVACSSSSESAGTSKNDDDDDIIFVKEVRKNDQQQNPIPPENSGPSTAQNKRTRSHAQAFGNNIDSQATKLAK